MQNIRDIMKIIGCDEARARRIFDAMSMAGLDFSECTNSQFRKAAKEAARTE